MNNLYVIDLFCGAGGFSEGAKQAGAKVILAIDCWQEALDIHELNHPECEHLNMELGGDQDEFISLISGFIDFYVPENGKVHIHASPPCQNLSIANNKYRDIDEGLRLLKWSLEILNKLYHTHIIQSYTVEEVYTSHALNLMEKYNGIKLNMGDYGLPARRNRVIYGTINVNNIEKRKGPNLDVFLLNNGFVIPGEYNVHIGCGSIRKKQTNAYSLFDKLCRTVTSDAPVFYNTKSGKGKRFSIEILKMLQTFPSYYNFTNSTTTIQSIRKMIGNAFPPQMSKLLLSIII
jgi:site-specific DNA-cytosine methylase